MAAATGWAWVASGGPLLPGYLSIDQGVTFESLGRSGYAAWDAVPESGKFQILGVIGILELLGEASVKPHYMMPGGTPGKIPLLWDPLGFTKSLSAETLARKRTAELKNGCARGSAPTHGWGAPSCEHTGSLLRADRKPRVPRMASIPAHHRACGLPLSRETHLQPPRPSWPAASLSARPPTQHAVTCTEHSRGSSMAWPRLSIPIDGPC